VLPECGPGAGEWGRTVYRPQFSTLDECAAFAALIDAIAFHRQSFPMILCRRIGLARPATSMSGRSTLWQDQVAMDGQPTWSAMTFLNEPEGGGRTSRRPV
jgi:hypothetical protein